MSDSTGARPKRTVHRNQPLSRDGLLERLFTVWFRGLDAELGEPARGRGDALIRRHHPLIRSERPWMGLRRFHIRTFQ